MGRFFRSVRWKAALALSLFAVAAVPAQAFAAYDPFKQPGNDQNVCQTGGGASSVCKGGGADPLTGNNGALQSVVTILAFVGGIIAAIFVVIGGIKYITSNGDSSQVASAKNTIIYALIGVVVAALARQLINFVLSRV